jgi:hypothetical protein
VCAGGTDGNASCIVLARFRGCFDCAPQHSVGHTGDDLVWDRRLHFSGHGNDLVASSIRALVSRASAETISCPISRSFLWVCRFLTLVLRLRLAGRHPVPRSGLCLDRNCAERRRGSTGDSNVHCYEAQQKPEVESGLSSHPFCLAGVERISLARGVSMITKVLTELGPEIANTNLITR